jgi:hypothetical protein
VFLLEEKRSMRIALFKDSYASFLQALDETGLTYEEVRPVPGQVVAAGTIVVIAQVAAIAGPFAAVLVAWIKARASRKIFLTLSDDRSIHLEGYSIEQVREILPLVKQMAVVDTKPADGSPDARALGTLDELGNTNH